MRTQAQLCHIESTRCVVLVMASEGGTVIASAIGEASSAEEAEDRALERLLRRLGTEQASASPPPHPPSAAPRTATPKPAAVTPNAAPEGNTKERPSKEETKKEVPKPSNPVPPDLPLLQSPEPQQADQAPSEAPTDPDDWSDELAAIDLELQRIGWDRAQERHYLERAFGHGSRHKVTRYSDLVAYIKRLQALEPGTSADQAPVPLRRSELISQGDQMLQSLQWEPAKARAFLQDKLGASSRQSLSDEQLLGFNMLLENEIVSGQ